MMLQLVFFQKKKCFHVPTLRKNVLKFNFKKMKNRSHYLPHTFYIFIQHLSPLLIVLIIETKKLHHICQIMMQTELFQLS